MFFLRLIVGGLIVALVPELVQRVSPRAAGLVLMLPVISIVALYIIARDNGIQAAGYTARGALVGLAALAAFFIVFELAVRHQVPILATFIGATAVWLITASILIK